MFPDPGGDGGFPLLGLGLESGITMSVGGSGDGES